MVKNILLLLASLGVFLLAAEGAFRLMVPSEPLGTTYGKAIQTNSHQFRDRDFEIPKPEGHYRILFLGDSFTWGVGLTSDETLPKQCQQLLKNEYPNVEVVNAALQGYNTVDELRQLQEKGLQYEPDLVVLIYFLNDIQYKAHQATINYDTTKVVPVFQLEKKNDRVVTDFKSGFRAFVLKCQMQSKLLAFLVPRVGAFMKNLGLLNDPQYSWEKSTFQGYTDENPGWLESKKALLELRDLCRARQIELVVAIYPMLVNYKNYGGRPAHETIQAYLTSLSIPNVDLLTVFETYKTGAKFWVNILDAHPNAEAQKLAAQALLPMIKARMLSASAFASSQMASVPDQTPP